MKYGLCNLGNYGVTIHKKKCYGLIIYNEIEDFFTILKHVIISRVITFRNKKLEKYEICDELYNSLQCIIKVKEFQSSSHIQKYVFHDQF
jgi:hypothetical protein